jgi:hypothetical protein
MLEILNWFISKIAYLMEQALNWHILGNLSLMHFVFGAILIVVLLNFITFGAFNVGGTADYFGGIRRTRNNENARDRERYASKTYETRYHNTGVVSNRTTRRLRE